MAQAASQLESWLTFDPSKQDGLAAFEMPMGAEHGFGEQENVEGDIAPKRQLKDGVLAV